MDRVNYDLYQKYGDSALAAINSNENFRMDPNKIYNNSYNSYLENNIVKYDANNKKVALIVEKVKDKKSSEIVDEYGNKVTAFDYLMFTEKAKNNK